VGRLEKNPRSGRMVPELGDESIREIVHGTYRLCTASEMRSSKLPPYFMVLALD